MRTFLREDARAEVVSVFQQTKNIRYTAKVTGVARNTVRSIIKKEGLRIPEQKEFASISSPVTTVQPDLGFLEEIFLRTRHPSDKTDHQKHLENILNSVKAELGGLLDTTDMMRLEAAMAQFILYRRHFMRSVDTSDKVICSEWLKNQEKLAKVANTWMDAALKALFAWNRLMRELEIKYGRRLPEGRNNFQINTQVNLGGSTAANSRVRERETRNSSDTLDT